MKYKSLILVASVVLIAAGCNKAANDNQDNNQANNTQNQQQNSQNQANTSNNTPAAQPNTSTSQTPKPGGTLESDLHFSGESDIGDAVDQPQVFQIDITKDGFYPTTIRVNKGDYVQFVNKDSDKHWPASNPHPSHIDLPGFDAKKGLATNEKFTYQFQKSGSWGFHDHFNSSFKGTVTVQ
jgi:plastocyanin